MTASRQNPMRWFLRNRITPRRPIPIFSGDMPIDVIEEEMRAMKTVVDARWLSEELKKALTMHLIKKGLPLFVQYVFGEGDPVEKAIYRAENLLECVPQYKMTRKDINEEVPLKKDQQTSTAPSPSPI